MSLWTFFALYFTAAVSAVAIVAATTTKDVAMTAYLSSSFAVALLCLAHKFSTGTDMYLLFVAYILVFGAFVIRMKKHKKGW